MLKLQSQYDFYKMPEEERIALVGRCFTSERTRHDTLYFPVQLAHGEFNYGKQQGLILVTSIMRVTPRYQKRKNEKWFRVAACSPDDLDRALDFSHEHCHLRQDVIDFLKKTNKKDVTYQGILNRIRLHFKAGKITS